MNVLETQFEAAVTGYKRPSNHGHVFETETGTDVTVHQSTLRQLSSCSSRRTTCYGSIRGRQ